MANDLRDRRRLQTAREIQQAALRLALRIGYGAVTTEAIAAEAGVSPRTFFNYYQNKQAAILGVPPRLDAASAGWIISSRQPLIDDIVRVLGAMIDEDRLDRRLLQLIQQLLERTPDLIPVFHGSLDHITSTLAELLAARFGPDAQMEAELTARLATSAMSQAVRMWGCDETMDQAEVLVLLRRQLQTVCTRLAAPVAQD